MFLRITVLFVCLLVIFPASAKKQITPQSLIGKTFVIRTPQKGEGMLDDSTFKKAGRQGNDYSDYFPITWKDAGKKGEIVHASKFDVDDGKNWNIELKFDDGRRFYTNMRKPIQLDISKVMVFDDNIKGAKKLIGKSFYAKRDVEYGYSIKNHKKVLIAPYTKFRVIGIDTTYYPKFNLYNHAHIQLKIRTENRQNLLIAYDLGSFYIKNPLGVKYSEQDKKDIKEQRIRTGMTKEEVLMSWGEPDSKNITATKWGMHEQWVYENTGFVYFDDEVVSAIQTSSAREQ